MIEVKEQRDFCPLQAQSSGVSHRTPQEARVAITDLKGVTFTRQESGAHVPNIGAAWREELREENHSTSGGV